MPSKIKTRTIKDGDRIAITEYRHQFAIDYIEQAIRNIELEIASKNRMIREILSDKYLDQTPVYAMGIKIRRMQIEMNRLTKSKGLLERNNKPVKVDSHTIAKSDKKIKTNSLKI